MAYTVQMPFGNEHLWMAFSVLRQGIAIIGVYDNRTLGKLRFMSVYPRKRFVQIHPLGGREDAEDVLVLHFRILNLRAFLNSALRIVGGNLRLIIKWDA